MKVAVLGANGVYARHLIPRLVQQGIEVRALVRRPEAAGVARGCGVQVLLADIFEPASLQQGLEGCDVCVNLATSLPGPSGRGDYAANDHVRREGVPRLLEACGQMGVTRLLQQSIAMVGANGDKVTDEAYCETPAGDDVGARALRAALDMEDAVRESDLDWLILRGALFYGPGTGFDDDWFARAALGKLRLPGDGSDFVSLVHIADMAAATVASLQRWASRQTLIIADNEPATWRDVFGYVSAISGAEPPAPGGRSGFASFRVSNHKARRALDWAPRYPNFQAGLVR